MELTAAGGGRLIQFDISDGSSAAAGWRSDIEARRLLRGGLQRRRHPRRRLPALTDEWDGVVPHQP